VRRRREEHEADARISPASSVGGSATGSADRPHFTSAERDPGNTGFKGTGASPGIARGPARVVLDLDGFGRVDHGDIIVCHASNASFVPILSIAAGLITNVGGILSHGAVVAREFGVPAVVGVADATTRIADGQELEIDGTTGAIHLV
jgi:pyruvate,water dikinase